MMQVNVSQNGTTTIKYVEGIELPTGTRTSKGPRASAHDYSDMQVGHSRFFTNAKDAQAMVQGFNTNKVNADARLRGRLTVKNLAKYKDLPKAQNLHGLGLPGMEYGVWMKAHKVEKAA